MLNSRAYRVSRVFDISEQEVYVRPKFAADRYGVGLLVN
jgi:hypothetical protein